MSFLFLGDRYKNMRMSEHKIKTNFIICAILCFVRMGMICKRKFGSDISPYPILLVSEIIRLGNMVMANRTAITSKPIRDKIFVRNDLGDRPGLFISASNPKPDMKQRNNLIRGISRIRWR